MLKGETDNDLTVTKNGVNKVLEAPVHLGSLAATHNEQVDQIKSIWVTTRDDVMVKIHFFITKYHSDETKTNFNC